MTSFLKQTFLIYTICLTSFACEAAILFAGGEDLDFPNGVLPCIMTTAGTFRAGYARQSLHACTAGDIASSAPFAAGVQTAAWVSARVYVANTNTNEKFFGVGKTSTSNSLFIGNSSANPQKLVLYKYNGASTTTLATESATSLVHLATNKIDMQIISFGATATVNIYVNGASSPSLTYTGDVTSGGATNFDDVRVGGRHALISCCTYGTITVSELIVADSDTRNLSVVTLAPNAAGSTNTFTSGTPGDLSEITTSDATVVNSATSGQTFQCNMTDLPSGSFAVQGVRVAVRASKAGTGPGSMSPGFYTTSGDSPSATALTGAWSVLQTIYQSTNPITSSAWTTSDINSIQLNLTSSP